MPYGGLPMAVHGKKAEGTWTTHQTSAGLSKILNWAPLLVTGVMSKSCGCDISAVVVDS